MGEGVKLSSPQLMNTVRPAFWSLSYVVVKQDFT